MYLAMKLAQLVDCSIRVYKSIFSGFLKTGLPTGLLGPRARFQNEALYECNFW